MDLGDDKFSFKVEILSGNLSGDLYMHKDCFYYVYRHFLKLVSYYHQLPKHYFLYSKIFCTHYTANVNAMLIQRYISIRPFLITFEKTIQSSSLSHTPYFIFLRLLISSSPSESLQSLSGFRIVLNVTS
jgi:hypothetical protein